MRASDLTRQPIRCLSTSTAHCCHRKARHHPSTPSRLLPLKPKWGRLVKLRLCCPRSRRPDRTSRLPRRERQTQGRPCSNGKGARRACRQGSPILLGLFLPSLLPRSRLPSACPPATLCQLKQPNPIAEHPDRLAVAPLPPAVADSTSAVIDALVKPYEAVFWALEVVEARLADSDFDGGDRAVRKARERLRAMGPLWEEVERRKGLA